MRNESHKSLIGTIRDHVIAWRKQEGWSRETVVHAITEAHERIDGPATSSIIFDPTTRDVFERQKVNADRVFRWLDDETKDNNLLPANFIPSILAAMPMDVRLHCADEFLRPLGMGTRGIGDSVDTDLKVPQLLSAIVNENSGAVCAVADLIDDQSIHALERAHKELSEAIEADGRARQEIESAINRTKTK